MSGRVWIGLSFIIFGIGFLLQQAGFWDFSDIFTSFWPLIFIIIGIIQLSNRSMFGLIFILFGGAFLLNDWLNINLMSYFWPLLLIVIGIIFLFSRTNRKKSLHSDRSIQAVSLFSGTELKSHSQNFEGGSVTSIFGGADIDLRDIMITDKEATLELTAIFGGISLYVPQDVRIEVTGIPLFGGWENKTRQVVDESETFPLLRIKCLAAFGGVEVNN